MCNNKKYKWKAFGTMQFMQKNQIIIYKNSNIWYLKRVILEKKTFGSLHW